MSSVQRLCALPWSATAPGCASSSFSNDPALRRQIARRHCGLCVDPPPHTPSSWSVDEKSQIQALDRTQPGLPLKKGRAGTSHDYERHGTTTLFAAMNILDGTVDRPQHVAPPPSGVHPFPQCRRETGSRGKDDPMPSPTTTPPISIPMFDDGSNVTRDGRSISRRHPLPGSMRSRASSRPLPSGGSRVASFAPSPTYKPRSTVSSRSTISNPDHSPGPPIQTKSSPPSDAGTKC